MGMRLLMSRGFVLRRLMRRGLVMLCGRGLVRGCVVNGSGVTVAWCGELHKAVGAFRRLALR